MPRPRPWMLGPHEDYHRDSDVKTPPILLPGVSPQDFLEVIREHVKKEYDTGDGVQDAWRKLPEIPSSSEIMRSNLDKNPASALEDQENSCFTDSQSNQDPILPFNLIDRPWGSKLEYIGAHYQLLREDGIASLRDSVAEVRTNSMLDDNNTTCVYSHVHVIGCTFSSFGLAIRVQFSTQRSKKRIVWKHSKRLQQGTLVALSPARDCFRSICKVAVVAARPLTGVELNPPQVDLIWGDINDADLDPVEEYLMVESRSGYFEAYRHVLVAMQKLTVESFPMASHLVSLDSDISAPAYVDNQPFRDLSLLDQQPVLKSNGASEKIVTTETTYLENVNILGDWPDIKTSSLETSQMAALKRILTKKVAIVQGPPGTGKTFVSISALKLMLSSWSSGDPPVIVSAQTNHALDQLLLLLADHEPNFIRLGGRVSKENARILERKLYNVKQEAPKGALPPIVFQKHAKTALANQATIMKSNINEIMSQGPDEASVLLHLGVITQQQFDSLQDDEWVEATGSESSITTGQLISWLDQDMTTDIPRCPEVNMGFQEEEFDVDFEEVEEEEEGIGGGQKDHDDDNLQGLYVPISETYTGRPAKGLSEKEIRRLLASTNDLFSIPVGRRGEVYRFFRRQLKLVKMEKFRDQAKKYEEYVEASKIAKWQAEATLIRRTGVKLVGCTTTGLSKYRGLLASLKPRIMLIEEAAETLEGTILAANLETLEHLILVGDHQQLPAHCNIRRLEEAPYSLSVSLFERLVNNGFAYTMLNRQRRMITDLRRLLSPFYPDLKDHPSVLDRSGNRKPVPGMGSKDLYFFHHQWPEKRDDASSYINIDEAHMIEQFFVYLVFNGIKPSQITILTFYNGQRKYLVNLLKKNQHLRETRAFNVFTVDSYQGEENDVVLLSLVRSNNNNNIGFLQSRNRTVVALSRARRGMYVFGNFVGLVHQSLDLWKPILDASPKHSININSGFPVVCSTHNELTVINDPYEWDTINGGCRHKCDSQLPCGHHCPYNCHPFSHEEILCREKCQKKLDCGHMCRRECGEKCTCECDQNSPERDIPAAFSRLDYNKRLNSTLENLPDGRNTMVSLEEEKKTVFWDGDDLDEVLGDVPKKKTKPQIASHRNNPKTSLQSQEIAHKQIQGFNQPPNTKVIHSSNDSPRRADTSSYGRSPSLKAFNTTPANAPAGSSRAWKEWNAQSADREVEAAKNRTARQASSGVTYHDTHYAVKIEGGKRVELGPVSAERHVHQDNTARDDEASKPSPTLGFQSAVKHRQYARTEVVPDGNPMGNYSTGQLIQGVETLGAVESMIRHQSENRERLPTPGHSLEEDLMSFESPVLDGIRVTNNDIVEDLISF